MAGLPQLPERYEATSVLGEGATGMVYLATDRVLGQQVAIKVVRQNLAMLARFRARFAREIAISAQFAHRHVVPLHDSGRLHDGRPFVALAYANRGSLEDIFEGGGSLDEGFRLLEQVLEALAVIHARGLVHQDLKPGNVLLHAGADGKNDAWLADLGVAGALSEFALDRKGMSGTPIWMAPEQLETKPQELGPWTDLYAIGLMIHAMLGGKTPRTNIAKKRLLERRRRLPKPLGNVPDDLQAVINNLMDPDPRQRYDRAADVIRALRDARTGWNVDETIKVARTILPAQFTTLTEGWIDRSQPREAEGGVPRWNRVPPDPLPPAPPRGAEPESAARASLALFALRDPRLVARSDLLQTLWDAAREVARRGEPQVVVVVGPQGAGKSRLVHAVATDLDAGGFMERVTLRYHSPARPDDGYRGAVRELLVPWSDSRDEMETRLTRWLGRERRLELSQVSGEASVLSRWCGFLREDETPVNAAVGLAYLYRYLDAHAWRGGTCLVLEDAHNSSAQGDGLEICEALLERTVGRRPVLALVTLDSEALESDPMMRQRVDALLSRGAVHVQAEPLSLHDMVRLLTESFSLAPDLAAVIAPELQGLPLHANLLVRDWATRGYLVRGEQHRFRLKRGTQLLDILVKDGDALAMRRVEGAIAKSEDPLGVASAMAATALAGREPPVPVVRQVSQEGLDALLATGIVRQEGWRLRFEHEVLHHAALALAESRPDLPHLHGQLADAWQALGEKTGADVNLPLGTHALLSGDWARALEPLLCAARTMVDEGRPTLALAAGRQAVQAADRGNRREPKVETRRQVCAALLELDRIDDTARVLDEIEALGDLDRRTSAVSRVLRARVAMAQGEIDAAKKLLHHASIALDTLRDLEALSEATHAQAILFRLAGRPRDAIARFERMLQLNKGNASVEAKALNGLVEARIASDDFDGVEHDLERLRVLTHKTGDTRNIAHYTYTMGLLHLRMKRLDEAERAFRTAQALAATLGADVLTLACQNNLGEVYRARGDQRAAEGFYRYVARFAAGRGWDTHAAVAHLNIAGLAMQQGKPRHARVEVERAERFLRDNPDHWAWLYVGLCRAVWAAEEADERTCRHWWKIAIQRGLGRVHVPELKPLLTHLASLSARRGWDDIAQGASRHV